MQEKKPDVPISRWSSVATVAMVLTPWLLIAAFGVLLLSR